MKRLFLLAAAILLTAAPGRTAEGPGLLLVPLLPASSPQEWYGPTLDRILEEKIRALGVFDVASGEKKAEALKILAQAERVDPTVLDQAVEAGGADYAVLGQFSVDDGRLAVDLRIFSTATMEQTASFQMEGPVDEVFRILTDGALFVADRFGITVSDEGRDAVGRDRTRSLEAYRIFYEARATNEPEEQAALLAEAVGLDPDFADAHVKLGLVLNRLGRLEEAVSALERAADLQPDVPETFNNLAVLYARLNQRKDALAAFEKALKLKPHYPEARLNYGRLLEENGRYDQAEGVYMDLLGKDPENVKARSSLALLYERTGRTELAVQEFRILSRTRPDLAEEFFLSRGKEARKAKEFKKAERFFKRAVDINPQYAEGYAELGTNSYLAGSYEESREQFLQALALEPQRGEFHHYLGLAQEKLGRSGEAQQSFLRSIELGGPVGSHLHLARIYLDEGDAAKAVDELNLVLAEDPGHTEARDLLSQAMTRSEADQRKDQERAAFATRRLSRLESIIEDLTGTNRELENRLLALQAERQDAARELAGLREEKALREAEFGERMEDALRSIEELSSGDEMEKLRDQYLRQVRSLEEEASDLRARLAEAEQRRMPDNAEIGEELTRERKKVALLEKTLADLADQKAEEGKELSRLQERSRGLEEKAGAAEEELGEARSELKSLRREAERLRSESGKSVRSAAGLKERNELLERTNRDLAKERDNLRRRVDDLAEDKADLERQLDKAGLDIEGLKRRVKEEKGDLADRLEDKERALADALEREEELRKRRDRLEGDNAKLRQQFEEARAELEEARRRADEEKGALAGRFDEKERDFKAALEREQELLLVRERLEKEKGDLGSALAVTQAELERVRESLTAASGEEGRLREAEKSLLVERGNLEREKSELEARLEEAARRRDEALRAEKSARDQVGGLRAEILALALEMGKLQMQERSWEKAAAAYEKVLEMDAANAEAYYRLGEIYFQLKRFDESKAMYQKAGERY